MMDEDDLDDIIDILNKNTDKPPLPKPKDLISIKDDKTPMPFRKYDTQINATCHSGGDMHSRQMIHEEDKESTNKKNTRRRSAVLASNSSHIDGPIQEGFQEEEKTHSS